MFIYVNFRLNMSLKLMGDMANVVGVGWEFEGRVMYSQEYNFLYVSVQVQNLCQELKSALEEMGGDYNVRKEKLGNYYDVMSVYLGNINHIMVGRISCFGNGLTLESFVGQNASCFKGRLQ